MIHATVPPQLEPEPAVQPKQCAAVMISRFLNFSGEKSLIDLPADSIYRNFKHLIKIAIKQISEPINAQSISAH